MAQSVLDPNKEERDSLGKFQDTKNQIDDLPTTEPDRALPVSFRKPVYEKPGNEPDAVPKKIASPNLTPPKTKKT